MSKRRKTTEKLQAIWLKRTHVIALQGFVEDMKPKMEKEYEEYLKPLTEQIEWCMHRGIAPRVKGRYKGSPEDYHGAMEKVSGDGLED